VLLTALGGCATNPVSGKTEAAFMSEEKEIDIGRKMDPEIRKQYGVYDSRSARSLPDSVTGPSCSTASRCWTHQT
jgi:hypothetical protein